MRGDKKKSVFGKTRPLTQKRRRIIFETVSRLDVPKRAGIYAIWHNNEMYVGETSNLSLRLQSHLHDAWRGKHSNYKLQSFLNLEGTWKFSVLELAPDLSAFDILEWRLRREAFWIIKFSATINIERPKRPALNYDIVTSAHVSLNSELALLAKRLHELKGWSRKSLENSVSAAERELKSVKQEYASLSLALRLLSTIGFAHEKVKKNNERYHSIESKLAAKNFDLKARDVNILDVVKAIEILEMKIYENLLLLKYCPPLIDQQV